MCHRMFFLAFPEWLVYPCSRTDLLIFARLSNGAIWLGFLFSHTLLTFLSLSLSLPSFDPLSRLTMDTWHTPCGPDRLIDSSLLSLSSSLSFSPTLIFSTQPLEPTPVIEFELRLMFLAMHTVQVRNIFFSNSFYPKQKCEDQLTLNVSNVTTDPSKLLPSH